MDLLSLSLDLSSRWPLLVFFSPYSPTFSIYISLSSLYTRQRKQTNNFSPLIVRQTGFLLPPPCPFQRASTSQNIPQRVRQTRLSCPLHQELHPDPTPSAVFHSLFPKHRAYHLINFPVDHLHHFTSELATQMASTQAPNPRAHLLAGLRTGGVRSASGPVPHTAAPAGTFNIPNIPRYTIEEEDELADMVSQNLYINNKPVNRMQQPPMTAAVDGGANRFSQQQGMGMNGSVPMSPFVSAQSQMQTLQLQMMQMEIARLQTLQAQQYQAELIAQAQAQAQQRQRQPQRRATGGYAPPATAGPGTTSFNLQGSPNGFNARRANQADQLRAMLGVGNEDQVPMTAALGGRFGSRMQSGQYDNEEDDFSYMKTPPTHHTSVISGGTALGGTGASPPSKSDAAVSWRRGGNSNSVLNGNNRERAVTSPVVRITPPPAERTSPSPPASSPLKTRPPALQFSAAISQPTAVVAVDASDADGEDNSSVSSKSGSTPSTPRTASSLGDAPPLSPREEASKKLYEGLGIRQVPTIAVSAAPPSVQRLVASTPVRQPRGPPSNNDELIPKNFATRSRRKAIGALGALLDARVSRETVAVC